MPTATPFNAIGAGNGFPSCLSKVNVSGFDHWTTLSGVNKTSPTTSAHLIAESLELAMMLYWNLTSIDCSADAYNLTDSVSVSGDIFLKDPPGYNLKAAYDLLDPLTPSSRVCKPFPDSTLYEDNSGGSFFRAVRAMVGITVVALYDGPTSDPDNFVGYGGGRVRPSDSTPSARTASVYAQWGGYCGVNIGGYLDEEGSSSLEESYGYKTFSFGSKTFHFAASAIARVSTGGSSYYDATASVNPTLTARSTFRRTSDDSLKSDAEVTLSSLDFYTY